MNMAYALLSMVFAGVNDFVFKQYIGRKGQRLGHFVTGAGLVWTLVFLAVTVVLFFLVFSNQEAVLAFMANTGWYAEAVKGTFLGRFEWMPKLVVSAVLLLFIPLVAFSYGRVTSAFMKLIKME